VIDEHINRIENSAAVHRSIPVASPTTSPRSSPCRTSATARPVSYWHKWVSPDEVPCRDVKRPSPTPRRSLPRRRSVPCDSTPRSRAPCAQKRKSCTGETEKSKKPKREPRVRERSPSTERDKTPRSVSPCYKLPTRKPPCKEIRKQTKDKTSPTQSPVNDRTVLFDKTRCLSNVTKPSSVAGRKSEFSETIPSSPNDCKPKPSTGYSHKRPCRQVDTTISTAVPQASLYGKDPCHNKTSTSTPRDVMSKPCRQQSHSERMTEERPYEQVIRLPALSHNKTDSDTVKPCRQLTTPQTTVLEGKPHSRCAQTESSYMAERFDLSKEIPCKQRAPVTSKETHKPDIHSSEIQQPRTSSENKPCKQAVEVEKQGSTRTDPLASSAERKCKNQPKTDTTVQFDASKDEKLHDHTRVEHSTEAVEYAKLHSKCKQASKPAVVEIEKLSKSDTLPTQAAVKTTGQVSTKKPCDKLENSKTLETAISRERKPCTKNVAEETSENKRRQRRRRNEDKRVEEDSAITPTLKAEQTTLGKQKDCKQKAVLNTYEQKPLTAEETLSKRETPAESGKISETTTTKKPCKNRKAMEHLTTTAETDAQKNLVTEDHKTKQSTSFTIEKPCKKNKAIESESVTRPEGLREDRITQNVETDAGKEKHQSVSAEKKPCKEKKTQPASLQAKEFAEIDGGKYDFATRSPRMEDVNKRKPCKPKTETKVPIPSDQAGVRKRKRCKDKPSAESAEPAENTRAESEIFTDKEGNDDQLITEQQRNEVEEPHPRCSADITDSVIAWMSHTSSLLSGPSETSASNQTLREPCFPAADSTANDAVTRVIQETVQQVALPIHGKQYHGETSEAEEEEQSSASDSPKSDTNRCGCPDAEKSKTPQETKEGVHTTSESKPIQQQVTQSINEEKVNCGDKLTSTDHKVSALPKKLKQRCRDMSPSQTDDGKKSDPLQKKTPNQQLPAEKSPCPKSKMPTTDQSVESTTRLIRRCKEARVLKLLKYKKKPPCKSSLLPDSSESLQSGGTGLSPYSSIEDQQLSDSELKQEMMKGRSKNDILDSENSKQYQEQSDSHQTASTTMKDHVLSKDIRDQKPLEVSDADSPVEVEKLAERLASADLTNIYSTKRTADSMQSFTTDTDETRMRKVQSDNRDVVTRRQNLSSEAVMCNSNPSVDVLDSWAQTATTKSIKSEQRKDSGTLRPSGTFKPLSVPGTVAEDGTGWDSSDDTSLEIVSEATKSIKSKQRRDSGVLPPGIFKPLTVPGIVAEDVSALVGWASDDTSSELVAKANVPGKLDTTPAVHSKQRRVLAETEKAPDESENWDSTEESVSETSPRPNDTGHVPVATKRCQDADNRDNNNSNNSCNRKAADELSETDWSDSSSSRSLFNLSRKRLPVIP